MATENLGKHREALDVCERVLARDPKNCTAWHNKSRALYELKQWDETLAACDRVLALDPTYVEAWCKASHVLHNLKRWEEALAAYEQVLTLDPRHDSWRNKNRALYELQRWEEALTAYDQALALDKNDANTRQKRDEVLAKLRQRTKDAEAHTRRQTSAPVKPPPINIANSRHFTRRKQSRLRQVFDWAAGIFSHKKENLSLTEKVSQKLSKIRPPRVHITYEHEDGDPIALRELPFIIGVLADFAGQPAEPLPLLRQRKFIEIDQDNFSSVMQQLKPRLAFSVDNLLTDSGAPLEVELHFNSLDDFSPECVASQVSPLRDLLREREVAKTHRGGAAFAAQITALDARLSRQLNAILHAPAFQRLEAAWRGLHYLVSRSPTGPELRIRVLNVTKKELHRDFMRANTLDQSALFHKLYIGWKSKSVGGGHYQCYRSADTDPFGALVADYEFDHGSQDMELLEKLAQVAEAVQAPVLTAASPHLFQLDSFTEINRPRSLAKIFDIVEYARWQLFRESTEACYVGLCLPRILLRLPYEPPIEPGEAFTFTEDVEGAEHNNYLWGNAAYAMATCLTNAFAKYGWCAAIRGPEGGGLVEGLPMYSRMTTQREVKRWGPVEVLLDERREKELADLGFLPLLQYHQAAYAAFFSASSVAKAGRYEDEEANLIARLSVRLPYVMAGARFAHYLQVLLYREDKVLSGLVGPEDVEVFLNRWLQSYVMVDEEASLRHKAEWPLRDASVKWKALNTPNESVLEFSFRPHFQLEVPPRPLIMRVWTWRLVWELE